MIAEIPWTTQSPLPILGLIQALPMVAALLLWFRRDNGFTFHLAVFLGVVECVLAVYLHHLFDPNQTAFQFAERLSLVPPLAYHAAADGMTVLFILLAAFLSLTAILYTAIRPFDPQPRFLSMIFLAETSLVSLFVTLDLLWFTLLSLLQVGLAGYLIHVWSVSLDKTRATKRFLQFMGLGLLLLMAGTGLLGWLYSHAAAAPWSFDLTLLVAHSPSRPVQTIAFFLLFYGLAVRIPLFPFHGWLPITAEHGNVIPALILLLGAKTGVYGLLRFVFPLVPDAVHYWAVYAVAIATLGIFYAALLAMMQQDLRRMIAYAVVSHHGILTIGLFTLQPKALQGSILLAVNFGLAVWTLFFMVGVINLRTRTVQFHRLGGLFDVLPMVGLSFFVAGLSIVGMPGTPGFNAAHLLLEAAIHRFGALETIAAALGNVASAAFLLWAFQRIFLAPATASAHTERVVDKATPMELFLATTMILVQLGAGFFSDPWLALMENTSYSLAAPWEMVGEGKGE